MLAQAYTFTIDGLQTRQVRVEVDVRRGLPAFTIVGLADAAVREARERVRAAILNSGYEFPARRITANLAPGDVPKAGAALDLALACAVLAASGQIPPEQLAGNALFGELALDGGVRPCRGTLAVAQATRKAGLSRLVLAGERAAEAQLVEELEVAVADSLRSAARVLGGGPADAAPPRPERSSAPKPSSALDLSDVRGQDHAVRALIIAAAGAHNCLLSGAPGTGKTMLAQRFGAILPPLSRSEAIELTRIHSIVGSSASELVRERPLRAPHALDHDGRVDRRRRARLGRRGRARAQWRAIPRRALRVLAGRARGAAPATGRRPRGNRPRTSFGDLPGTLHAARGKQPVSVRLRRRR